MDPYEIVYLETHGHGKNPSQSLKIKWIGSVEYCHYFLGLLQLANHWFGLERERERERVVILSLPSLLY